MKKLNLAIIGHGFVGKAVDYGFTNEYVNKWIVDPKDGLEIKDIYEEDIDISFVCVPTPMGDDGSIDSSIVESVVDDLIENVSGLIVLKSTVTPDIVKRLAEKDDCFVYNPEFLVERHANSDFVNPQFHVLGGVPDSVLKLETIYKQYSNCRPAPFFYMEAVEASFVKYGINSFLATKVTWFNEYKKLVDGFGANYDTVALVMGMDPRVSHSHTQVPGPDGRLGFGGACFTKDTAALNAFADGGMTVLNHAINVNNEIRSQYELDEREREQNVKY